MKELIKKYKSQDLSCSETMLKAADEMWKMNISDDLIKASAGLGAGLHTKNSCGIVTSACLIIGVLFTKERAHNSPIVKKLCIEFQEKFTSILESSSCAILLDTKAEPEIKCLNIIIKGAELLYSLVEENRKSIVR